MRHPYALSLRNDVFLREEDTDLILVGPDGQALRIRNADGAQRRLLEYLVTGGMSLDELCENASREVATADLARLYYLVARAEAKAFLRYTLVEEKAAVATLEPISPEFRFEAAIAGRCRLSRFACLRRDGGETVLESPLGHARLVLHDARAAALVAYLAEPHTADEVTALHTGLHEATIGACLSLLHNMRAAFPCDADGRIFEDEDVPLRQWEFHDLFFHTRSRTGRHAHPVGATFRFVGTLPPLPAIKPPMSEKRVELARPESAGLAGTGQDFFEVLEKRCSRRGNGRQPIDGERLGLFLYHCARVKEILPATPDDGRSYEASVRPCASGGALHELEIYLTISRCTGIAPGFYRYDPTAHGLEPLSDLGPDHGKLLADARRATGMPDSPDILLTLAARFQRDAWKYQSIAYALVLKHVGILYQQMYLVATALGLAPCGVGAGDSDLFSRLTGLDYFAETSVGEFMLSGMD